MRHTVRIIIMEEDTILHHNHTHTILYVIIHVMSFSCEIRNLTGLELVNILGNIGVYRVIKELL